MVRWVSPFILSFPFNNVQDVLLRGTENGDRKQKVMTSVPYK